MKTWMYALAFAAVSCCTGCSKDALEYDEISTSGNVDGYISNWEGGYTWARQDSADYIVFSHDKSLPQLTGDILRDGMALVAIKNVPYKPDSLQTQPRVAPFSVIPYYGVEIGKPAYDQHWYTIPREGGITIKYRSNRHIFTNEPVIPPDERVEARYFLLTAADLQSIGHTKISIQGLTYEDLVALLGTVE